MHFAAVVVLRPSRKGSRNILYVQVICLTAGVNLLDRQGSGSSCMEADLH